MDASVYVYVWVCATRRCRSQFTSDDNSRNVSLGPFRLKLLSVFMEFPIFCFYMWNIMTGRSRMGDSVGVRAGMYINVCVRACVQLVHGKKSAQFST